MGIKTLGGNLHIMQIMRAQAGSGADVYVRLAHGRRDELSADVAFA
jgi:hypothetical protein